MVRLLPAGPYLSAVPNPADIHAQTDIHAPADIHAPPIADLPPDDRAASVADAPPDGAAAPDADALPDMDALSYAALLEKKPYWESFDIPIKREWWHEDYGLRPLTPRQEEILCLSWYTDAETGRFLGISGDTAANHRRCLYCKLGIRTTTRDITRVRGIVRAIQKGIMGIEDFEIGERTRLTEAEERFLERLRGDPKYTNRKQRHGTR